MQRYLKVLHDLDQLGAVRRRQTAPLVEDGFQLCSGQLIKVQLDESVPEGSGEHLQINEDRITQTVFINREIHRSWF